MSGLKNLGSVIWQSRFLQVMKHGLSGKVRFHIKDEYFKKAQDSNLMQNKENGTYRPTFYCLRDEKTSLLWMVPLSTRIQKFQALHDKQVQKYGRCLTIVLGVFDGKEAAFLLQNMFPIRSITWTISIPAITILCQ